MNCCQNVPSVDCDVQEILQRIEPIQYVDGVLVVDAPVSAQSAVYINNQPLTIVSGDLELPADSTIDGSPLDGLPFTGDILDLPPQTTIDNFSIFTTNYFYFFNVVVDIDSISGEYIVNSQYTSSPSTNNIRFPFIAPENCILTSFIFTFAVGSSAPSTITNATGYIDVINTAGVITYTGISATIPLCPKKTKYYAEKKIQYSLPKGHSVGIRFTFDGTAGSWRQFAVLGYKFTPPV